MEQISTEFYMCVILALVVLSILDSYMQKRFGLFTFDYWTYTIILFALLNMLFISVFYCLI